jgi:nitrate reductase gamma subunit
MSIVTGLGIIAVAMVVAVGGLLLVQRLFSTELRKQANDVAGFIYAVLGVAYAVLLGAHAYRRLGKMERGRGDHY